MVSAPDRPLRCPWPSAFGISVLTATLVWFGFGLDSIAVLTWLIPIPALWLSTRVSLSMSLASSVLGYAAGLLTLWQYASEVGLPVVLVAATIAVCAIAFALTVAVFRAMARRGAIVAAILATASTAIVADWLMTALSPDGAFLSISATQADTGWLMPATAVAGRWLVTGALWAMAGLVVALTLRVSGEHLMGRLLVTAAGLAVVVAGSAITGAVLARTDDATHRVAAITVSPGSVSPTWGFGPAEFGSADGATTMRQTVDAIREVRSQGAEVIVLGESTVILNRSEMSALTDQLRWAADGSIVVAGLAVREPAGEVHNTAVLLEPGRPIREYRKRHLAPGEAESGVVPGQSGTSLVVETGLGRIGVAICKDLDFPGTMRGYGNAAADMLLVPAWDADLDGRYHADIARITAAENGISMVRAARQGLSTTSSATGALTGQRSTHVERTDMLVADLPARGAVTPYARFGDWLPWVCAVYLLTLAACGTLRLRRTRLAGVPQGRGQTVHRQLDGTTQSR